MTTIFSVPLLSHRCCLCFRRTDEIKKNGLFLIKINQYSMLQGLCSAFNTENMSYFESASLENVSLISSHRHFITMDKTRHLSSLKI